MSDYAMFMEGDRVTTPDGRSGTVYQDARSSVVWVEPDLKPGQLIAFDTNKTRLIY